MQLGLYREYSGGFVVPLDFAFPPVNLRSAWDAWMVGFPNNRSTRDKEVLVCPVRPLRHILRPAMFPKTNKKGARVRTVWANDWRPVLSEMQKGLRTTIPKVRAETLDAEFLEKTYLEGRLYFETTYPSLFDGANNEANRTWKISTWSKNVRAADRRARREGAGDLFYG